MAASVVSRLRVTLRTGDILGVAGEDRRRFLQSIADKMFWGIVGLASFAVPRFAFAGGTCPVECEPEGDCSVIPDGWEHCIGSPPCIPQTESVDCCDKKTGTRYQYRFYAFPCSSCYCITNCSVGSC